MGEVGARKIARHFRTIDALLAASVDELAQVEDVGDVTARAVSQWFADPAHQAILQRLRLAGLQFTAQVAETSGPLQGYTFVVSGVFEHFSRDAIKADIEQHGGRIAGSISGKTSFLLAGEKMGPEKRRKAESLGVPIISETDYLKMLQ